MSRAKAVKLLKSSNVKQFSGEETREEFLIGLEEAVYDGRMSDDKILHAISTVLDKSVLWCWRATRDSVYTWREFRRELKSMYITEYDEEDLWRDLRQRTQVEREKVTA